MNNNNHINYVEHKNIDVSRWDQCMNVSNNGLIYGYALYLDHMARNWDALILNDYEAVMPLTWNKKWGIKYLYQPPLTQQLGVFSSAMITDAIMDMFILQLHKHFKFAEIYLNYNNHHQALKKHDNYILSLNTSYEDLSNQYDKHLQRNLKKTSGSQFHYGKSYELQKALALHQQQYSDRTPHVHNIDYAEFEKLCLQFQRNGEIVVRSIHDDHQELLAVVVLLQKKERLYLIEPTTTGRGRALRANHFLLDAVIKEFAGNNLVLDFVGSDIPGIARFYKDFGPANQPYFFYRFNNLPWPARVLKP